MTISVAINGLGRIGRTILRQIASRGVDSPFRITRLNDIAGLDMIAYLLRFDSVFGLFPGDIGIRQDQLVLNGVRIPFSDSARLEIDLSDTDILLDCTGKARTRSFVEFGIKAGAQQTLISGPSPAADVTIVLGANEHTLGDARVVSNASCTTNALAPLLKSLDELWGLETAHMTTIHCYTGSQPMSDAPRADMARSRAGGLSMVPTTTSAHRLIDHVLPHLAGRVSAAALRVPTASVSAVDIVAQFRRLPDGDLTPQIKAMAENASVMGWTADPNVSSDLRARPESVVLALPETQRVQENQLRVFGWYDNEWGFSARMLDMAQIMTSRPQMA